MKVVSKLVPNICTHAQKTTGCIFALSVYWLCYNHEYRNDETTEGDLHSTRCNPITYTVQTELHLKEKLLAHKERAWH
jgi:hypothetical protein